ncbi:MAG: DUF1080 domain-containing protein [Planctomycetota bacterium]
MTARLLVTSLCSLLLLGSVSEANDWVPLFPENNFSGWTNQREQPVDTPAWSISSGVVQLDRSKGRGGNILTAREYGDFELVFEWKVAPGANNGIKYRVQDFNGRILGCEYQIIDDPAKPNLNERHRTACLYDIYETSPHELLRPAGEFVRGETNSGDFNRGRIVVSNNTIEHWLNGHLMVRAFVGSPEWQARIGESKFSDVDGFGLNQSGRIMITDHGSKVWLRNMFIRELRPAPAAFPVMQPCYPLAAPSAFFTQPGPIDQPQIFGRPAFMWFRRVR